MRLWQRAKKCLELHDAGLLYKHLRANTLKARMISKPVTAYLFLWVTAVLVGLAVSFSDLVPGFHHEFRTASVLNLILFFLTVILLFTSICKTERTLRMLVWFVHYTFLAPVLVIWIYAFHEMGNSRQIFWFFICFISIPLVFFSSLTGIALGGFLYSWSRKDRRCKRFMCRCVPLHYL